MWETVYRYFILNGELSLPGIGTFNIERTVTRSDFANRQIHPSVPVIRFTHDHKPADKEFYQYLSIKSSISEQEAIKQFHDLVHVFQTGLTNTGKTRLQGIGTLIKEFSHTFSFQPEWDAADFYKSVAAERIIRRNTETPPEEIKPVLKKKKIIKQEPVAGPRKSWIVPAIILTIIAIAAIVYYYLTQPANSF
ncbi:MAG: hypothetical protein JWN76_1538 [Chitinophagaceae bacterium]|nr:hypothetical protein [Chitinophagaceae bacterium]